MRKYRQTSQSDGDGFNLPKNPIPWTTKLLVGITIFLAVVFSMLLAMRKSGIPILSNLLDENEKRQSEEVTISPAWVVASSVPTPTFPPGSAWLAAITITTIYSGPGEEYARIGILEGGDRARIVGKNPDGDWWAIQVPYVESGRGWVSDAQVEANDTEGVTELTEEEPNPEAEVTPSVDAPTVTAVANTNIRSGPGLEFVKIGLLAEGQEAEILGRDPESFWWMIRVSNVKGERGWVSRDYVVAQNANNVPVIGSSIVQFGMIPSPAPEAPSLSASVVINIRSGPGTNFAIIGKLTPDQEAEIVGISPDGVWWAIKIPSAQNQRGWVSAQYVTVENAEGVPVIR